MAAKNFDELILELAESEIESFEHCPSDDRVKLVRFYFEETQEWGDAFFDPMPAAFEAFEQMDYARFGMLMAARMTDYVKGYITKQLAYQAECRRERREMAEEFEE